MIVFELTFPNVGSWNGKWSGSDRIYVRTRDERKVPKEYWNKDFYYRWEDGWTARVLARRMTVNEARKLEKRSSGFCGYDWMINSIIKHSEIKYEGQ